MQQRLQAFRDLCWIHTSSLESLGGFRLSARRFVFGFMPWLNSVRNNLGSSLWQPLKTKSRSAAICRRIACTEVYEATFAHVLFIVNLIVMMILMSLPPVLRL